MARCERRSHCRSLAFLLLLAAQSTLAEVPGEIRQALLMRDYAGAAAVLVPLAEEGDADASYELARLWDRGLGVPRDPTRSVAYLQRAAAQGHADAAYLLGTFYEQGHGVAADPARAAALFVQAAAQGHELALRKQAQLRHDDVPGGTVAQSVASQRVGSNQLSGAGASVNSRDGHGRLPLGTSAQGGRLGEVNDLLLAGALVSAQDAMGNSALHYAVQAKARAVVERLLAAGADTALADGAGNTPLHLAVAGDQAEIARLLLRAGAPGGQQNHSGWTPAMLAQRADNPALRELFGQASAPRAGASLTQLAALQTNSAMHDWSLLSIAAWRGEIELIRQLLADGADINAADASGMTPLSRAVMGKRLAAARYLIEQGADLSPAVDGSSPLHEAIRQRDDGMVKLLAVQPTLLNHPDGAGRSPLVLALQSEDWAIAEVLLARGAAADSVDGAGNSPLHLVTRSGNLDLARQLLTAGAPVNLADRAGRTPLWWAAKLGSASLVSLFLAAGALDAPALDGSVPVHQASQLANVKVLGLLVDAGHALDVRTDAGSTPLLLAAERGGLEVVQYLADATNAVNTTDNVGDSPLICAVRNDRKDVARVLMARGANPHQRNGLFVSAGDLAETHEDAEWDKILASSAGLLGLFGSKG